MPGKSKYKYKYSQLCEDGDSSLESEDEDFEEIPLQPINLNSTTSSGSNTNVISNKEHVVLLVDLQNIDEEEEGIVEDSDRVPYVSVDEIEAHLGNNNSRNKKRKVITEKSNLNDSDGFDLEMDEDASFKNICKSALFIFVCFLTALGIAFEVVSLNEVFRQRLPPSQCVYVYSKPEFVEVPMNYVEEENIEEIEIKEEIVVDSDSSSLRAEKSFSTVNSSKPRRDKWGSISYHSNKVRNLVRRTVRDLYNPNYKLYRYLKLTEEEKEEVELDKDKQQYLSMSAKHMALKSLAKKRLFGFPVLFLHGHGGSYDQARNFAHTASYMHEVDEEFQKKKPLDFFSADFKEELSAFSGVILWRQTRFVIECVKAILELYKEASFGMHVPKSVILMGHSMGGMLARAVITLDDFEESNLVKTIITLGTPHIQNPFPTDHSVNNFYDHVNNFWSSMHVQNTYNISVMADDSTVESHDEDVPKGLKIDDVENGVVKNSNSDYDIKKKDDGFVSIKPFVGPNVVIASISGGKRDVLIREDFSSIRSLVSLNRGITVVTTSVPSLFTSINHDGLTTCNRILPVLNKVFWDLLEDRNEYESPEKRLEVLSDHLLDPFVSRVGAHTWKSHKKIGDEKEGTSEINENELDNGDDDSVDGDRDLNIDVVVDHDNVENDIGVEYDHDKEHGLVSATNCGVINVGTCSDLTSSMSYLIQVKSNSKLKANFEFRLFDVFAAGAFQACFVGTAFKINNDDVLYVNSSWYRDSIMKMSAQEVASCRYELKKIKLIENDEKLESENDNLVSHNWELKQKYVDVWSIWETANNARLPASIKDFTASIKLNDESGRNNEAVGDQNKSTSSHKMKKKKTSKSKHINQKLLYSNNFEYIESNADDDNDRKAYNGDDEYGNGNSEDNGDTDDIDDIDVSTEEKKEQSTNSNNNYDISYEKSNYFVPVFRRSNAVNAHVGHEQTLKLREKRLNRKRLKRDAYKFKYNDKLDKFCMNTNDQTGHSHIVESDLLESILAAKNPLGRTHTQFIRKNLDQNVYVLSKPKDEGVDAFAMITNMSPTILQNTEFGQSSFEDGIRVFVWNSVSGKLCDVTYQSILVPKATENGKENIMKSETIWQAYNESKTAYRNSTNTFFTFSRDMLAEYDSVVIVTPCKSNSETIISNPPSTSPTGECSSSFLFAEFFVLDNILFDVNPGANPFASSTVNLLPGKHALVTSFDVRTPVYPQLIRMNTGNTKNLTDSPFQPTSYVLTIEKETGKFGDFAELYIDTLVHLKPKRYNYRIITLVDPSHPFSVHVNMDFANTLSQLSSVYGTVQLLNAIVLSLLVIFWQVLWWNAGGKYTRLLYALGWPQLLFGIFLFLTAIWADSGVLPSFDMPLFVVGPLYLVTFALVAVFCCLIQLITTALRNVVHITNKIRKSNMCFLLTMSCINAKEHYLDAETNRINNPWILYGIRTFIILLNVFLLTQRPYLLLIAMAVQLWISCASQEESFTPQHTVEYREEHKNLKNYQESVVFLALLLIIVRIPQVALMVTSPIFEIQPMDTHFLLVTPPVLLIGLAKSRMLPKFKSQLLTLIVLFCSIVMSLMQDSLMTYRISIILSLMMLCFSICHIVMDWNHAKVAVQKKFGEDAYHLYYSGIMWWSLRSFFLWFYTLAI